MAETPPPDDPSDFELAVDDDLLAAAVAAVEARMAPRPAPEPDPEAEAAFAADLEVEFESDDDAVAGIMFEDDEGDTEVDPDPSPAPASGDMPREPDAGVDLQELAASKERIEVLETEITELLEQLDTETRERRRATAIAVRLKERAQRSDLQVANARNGRAAAEQRIEELESAIAQMEDERARNRERRRREVEDARQQGVAPTLKELLPVLDHLEMAIAHADAEPEKLVEGVEMIAGQFERALGAQGVTRVAAEPGTPFDPEHHEALERVETEDYPPGTVTTALRAGFLLNGRLLRAARVTVSTAPASDVPAAPSPTSEDGETVDREDGPDDSHAALGDDDAAQDADLATADDVDCPTHPSSPPPDTTVSEGEEESPAPGSADSD